MQVFDSLPVNFCSAERSFSAMKLPKIYLRSTMREDGPHRWLFSIHIKKVAETVHRFGFKNRRLQFLKIIHCTRFQKLLTLNFLYNSCIFIFCFLFEFVFIFRRKNRLSSKNFCARHSACRKIKKKFRSFFLSSLQVL